MCLVKSSFFQALAPLCSQKPTQKLTSPSNSESRARGRRNPLRAPAHHSPPRLPTRLRPHNSSTHILATRLPRPLAALLAALLPHNHRPRPRAHAPTRTPTRPIRAVALFTVRAVEPQPTALNPAHHPRRAVAAALTAGEPHERAQLSQPAQFRLGRQPAGIEDARRERGRDRVCLYGKGEGQ